jgi:hypothetical protein
VTSVGVLTFLTILWGVAVVLWGHQLTPAQRNGHAPGHDIAALVLVVLVVATIALWIATALAIATRIAWPGRVLRAEGRLALGMTAAMMAILGGTATWWAAEAAHAPGFLSQAVTGTSGATAPPVLIAVGLCMVAGLALALTGSWWVARSPIVSSPDRL